MKKLMIGSAVILLAAFVILPFTQGQASKPTALADDKSFNPRDLSGVWWVENAGPDKLMERGRKGDASKCQTCHVPEHTMPEPPLTPWAMDHLFAPNEKAHMLAGKGSDPNSMAPSSKMNRATCDPVGVPAQFWFTQLTPFEIVMIPGRIFQFFEAHNEYRTIWMNREHPAKPDPTYMGDSIGKWEGDTLVVDTISFNGKNMIEPVGVNHLMSDSFHLVERWRRIDKKNMELDLTYYDPKVWGDQPWGGLKKEFILQPGMQLMEEYCNKEDNDKFDQMFLTPSKPSGQ